MSHKEFHEIRDPVHVFIRVTADERHILDSPAFQRLRDVHQLAMTYLVYPGATHKRFEHSLGVMELATRAFDVLTSDENVAPDARNMLGRELTPPRRQYWRSVVRAAALLHDVGHLPFSHAAEKDLLPQGKSHEDISREIIQSDNMKTIWAKMTPPLRSEDIVKAAVGPSKARNIEFTPWEALVSEIITGDAFGVDRIDYLLRDSYHLGVAYGRFDHYRLIDSLRILVTREQQETMELESASEPTPRLGIEHGGLQSAEALALARYYMYTQVYFHPVRRAYDIHLKDFMMEWLKDGKLQTKPAEFLKMSDSNVIAALRERALSAKKSGHIHAKRLMNRQHFRSVYERNPIDKAINLNACHILASALVSEFGKDNVREDSVPDKKTTIDFPVRMRDGRIVSALSLSNVLGSLPPTSIEYIFVERSQATAAEKWLEANRDRVLNQSLEGQNAETG